MSGELPAPRVLLDLSVAPPGGANTYAVGFVTGLLAAAVPEPDRVVVVVDERWALDHPDLVGPLRAAGYVVDAVAFPPPGSWQARLRRGGILRRVAARHGVDAAFFPREVTPRFPVPHALLANNLYAWRSFSSSSAVGGRVSAFLLRQLARRSAAHADAVLVVSRALAEAMPASLEIAAVIHHGCALAEADPDARARPDDGVRRVAMVGNLIPNKGIEVVIDGVARARRAGGAWELAVHGQEGTPDYVAELTELGRRQLGASPLVGAAYGDDLGAAYAAADVVAMGGSFESFCFPLVEAMRSGCVVVAPACALVEEICGDVAVTYREGDPADLAAALDRAWAERAERIAAGVVRSRAFSWADTARRTVELTRATVRPAGRPRVLVDLSVAPLGGASTYATGFLTGLVSGDVDHRDEVVVVVDRAWASRHHDLVAAASAVGVTVDAVAFPPPGTVQARLRRSGLLRRTVDRHHADVVYIPREVVPRTGRPYVLLARNLYAWEAYHSSAAVGGPVPAMLLRHLARRSARGSEAVLAVSQVLASVIEREVPVAAVVHHGCVLPEIDRSEQVEDDDRPRRVLMVGNVIANKGMEVVIGGVARARAAGGSWELVVHGARADAGYAHELDRLATELLGATVLAGPAHGDALAKAYAEADVVVMGGTFETFCFPLVEAMRSGCVVVAPSCALVEEICGDVAVTYREGDVESLAAALASGWEQRADRRARGLVRSRHFTWERAVEQTLELVRGRAPVP